MKMRKITYLVCLSLFVGLLCISSPVSGTEAPVLNEGTWTIEGNMLYEQNLGEAYGLCVEGINSIDGQTSVTDQIIAGSDGSASWRALEFYWSDTSASLPHYISQHDDTVMDMVKYEDPIDHNMDLIYAQRASSASGGNDRIVKQRGVNPSVTVNELNPDWYLTTDDSPESLALGNFDADADPEVVALCVDGKVYGFDNLNAPSAWTRDLDWYHDPSFKYKYVKHTIAAVDNLDVWGLTWQDVVVGHDQNVTAISTGPSKSVIWTVDILTSGYICSVLDVGDQNSDGTPEIVAATTAGIYLLSGVDGSVLASKTGIGSFRDVQLFNSTAIITGNRDGSIFVLDVNTASPTFNDFLVDISFGSSNRRVNVILNVGDFNSDGQDEFAVGGDSLVGVLIGNNATWQWRKTPIGSIWLQPDVIEVYDMALMDDIDGDFIGDLAVIGHTEYGSDSAMFIYDTFGAWKFIPDLSGYGYADTDCTEDNEHVFVFTATAYQKKGLPVTAEISLDDEAWHPMTQGSGTWQTGMTFIYEHTGGFPSGEHRYKFRFTDTTPDIYITDNKTFQIGNCGSDDGGLDIPGAGIWMTLASIGIGIALMLATLKKHRH